MGPRVGSWKIVEFLVKSKVNSLLDKSPTVIKLNLSAEQSTFARNISYDTGSRAWIGPMEAL